MEHHEIDGELPVELLGELGDRRHTQDEGVALDLVRRPRHEVTVQPEDLPRVLEPVHDLAGQHLGPDLVQPELEGGDHAEVAAPSPQGPEEARVLVGTGPDQPSGRGHDIGRLQVVDGHAVLAREVAVSPPEGEARHSHR